MVEERYEQAKRRLRELQYERSNLTNSLRSAIKDGDSEEISRLRLRQVELPREISEAEIDFYNLKVGNLRAEQTEAQQEIELARLKSKETDLRVEVELKELDAKRKALSDERYARLAYVYRLNDSILNRSREIQVAEQELRKRLEQMV
jgi:hypothetical protein